jgi:hypothetical protein
VGGGLVIPTPQERRQAAAWLCTGLWPVKSRVVAAGCTATPVSSQIWQNYAC